MLLFDAKQLELEDNEYFEIYFQNKDGIICDGKSIPFDEFEIILV